MEIVNEIKNEFFCLCFEAGRWAGALWTEHNGDNEGGDNEHNQHLQGLSRSVHYLSFIESDRINEMIIKSRHVNIGYHAVGGEPTIPSLPV